jgi:uncharacterized membrane protein YuzA (DUF378 family)
VDLRPKTVTEVSKEMIINKIALIISIIGSLNWGLVGLFSFDLVAWISGGPETLLARIIYVIVALAGIWCISLLFRDTEAGDSDMPIAKGAQ